MRAPADPRRVPAPQAAGTQRFRQPAACRGYALTRMSSCSPLDHPPGSLERLVLPATTRVRARLRSVEAVALPGWLGSMFHGALGHALRELCCSPACERGHAAGGSCEYRRLFERPPVGELASGRLKGDAPMPLVLEVPPPGEPCRLARGAELSLGVVLIGRARRDLASLTSALQRIGGRGLGAGRGRLELVALDTDEVPAQRASTGAAGSLTPRDLKIVARTPLRLFRGGELTLAPGIPDLALAIAHRTLALSVFHDDGDPGVRIEPIGQALADSARSTTMHWRRLEVTRYSERQDRRHAMEGVLGEITAAAVPAWAAHLLALGERIGVGKSSGFGFGRIAILPIDPPR